MKRLVLLITLAVLLVAGQSYAIEQFEPVIFHNGTLFNDDGSTVTAAHYATLGMDVTITGTATVTFQARSHATETYRDIRCVNTATGAVGTSTAASGNFQCPVAGQAMVKAPVSSCSGCTVYARGRLTTAPPFPLQSSAAGGGGLTDAELRASPVPISGTVTVTDGAGAVNVIVDSSALPSGAATSALQDGIVKDGAGDTTQANVSSGRLHVDGSGVTQPISGTVTANAGTGNFTVVQGTGTNLHVVCDSGCSSSAGFADNSAFTFGTTAVSPIAGVLDDTGTNAATENSAAIARITAQKALHANLRNNSGAEIGVSAAPLRVDPTGTTTQPVSGTVTVTDGAGSLNVIVDSITAGDNNIGNVDIVTMPNVTVGTFPDNEPFNVAQINGVTPLMGNGVTGTGSQRVTVASDNTPFSVNIGTFPDNEPVNVAQMNGVAVTMGNGASGTGVQRVTIASDSTGLVTEQSATAILAGQQAVNGTAAALASNTTKEVCVKAFLANTVNVYVGPSGVTTSTGLELGPGDSYCTRVTNSNALFVIASGAGPSVSWAARN